MKLINDIKTLAALLLLTVLLGVGCGNASEQNDTTDYEGALQHMPTVVTATQVSTETPDVDVPQPCAQQDTQMLSPARLGSLRRKAVAQAVRQAREECGDSAQLELDAVAERFGKRTVNTTCLNGAELTDREIEEETYELDLKIRTFCDAPALNPMSEVDSFDNVESIEEQENILVEQARFDDMVDRCESYDCCIESARGVERCNVEFPEVPGL